MISVCEIPYSYRGEHDFHIPGNDAVCTANRIPVYTAAYPIMRKSLSIIAFSYVFSLTVLQNKILYLEILICNCDSASGTVAEIVQNQSPPRYCLYKHIKCVTLGNLGVLTVVLPNFNCVGKSKLIYSTRSSGFLVD